MSRDVVGNGHSVWQEPHGFAHEAIEPVLLRALDGLEFNVSHLLRLDVGGSVTDVVDTADPLRLDNKATKRIEGNVRLLRTNFGILAQAKLCALVQLECDRCLDPYDTSIAADFAEEYLPVVDVASGRPVQSERTDETFFISPNHIVDLTEAARQHLLLAMPMHAICREGCLGLCVVCGANRNECECGCVMEVDHPFSAIASLIQQNDQN
ncbi:MAG TPA: DUF177 domain-containing protein [Chloroflexota bacterium]|jgi:uncharacterized protein|nr:DUF177 domain-containing protein [Chloroflexota bacterium]